jgi:hypothetical protein
MHNGRIWPGCVLEFVKDGVNKLGSRGISDFLAIQKLEVKMIGRIER